jgi:long-chain acyl-CoA synthetase
MVSSFPVKHPWDRRLGFWWLAAEFPDRPAIVEAPTWGPTTMGELAGKAHQLVHALRGKGLAAGDVIAYALPNDGDPVLWQLACQEGGFSAISLNPQLSPNEIRATVDHAGAAAVVIHKGYEDRANELEGTGSVTLRVVVGGPIDGFTSYGELVEGFPTTAPENRRLGYPVAYSSGTTGKPKAIVRPKPSDMDPWDFADEAAIFGRAFQFVPFDGAHLVSAGMHHGGCQSYFLGALNVGQPLVIMGKFDAERALQLIEDHKVTTAYMVPTQFVRLLKLPDQVRATYDVSSLKVVVHSAAPCPRGVKQAMMDWWGPVIWETYGGMEGAATICKPQRWLEKPGTVGRAVKGMRIKVLDDDGTELPAGQIGHVYLEPDSPTFEYKNDPELDASVRRGKAFTLGEVGYVDEDGYLFLRDRAKDMIVSGGVNIYPAEVEAVLSMHPKIGDAAVIGVPDDEWGEQVKAVVELVEGETPSAELEAEIVAFCQDRLTKYKCPRSVDFRAQLPRTDHGKLMKRNLRDEYWAAAGRLL